MSEIFYPQCRVVLSVVFDQHSSTTPDSAPVTIPVIPKACTVNLVGYKSAGTWSLTFDSKALPLSPDLIRSLNVEIRMFDAKSINPADIVAQLNDPRNLSMAGLADNISLTWAGQGHELIADGQDYTSLLISKVWDQTVRVPHGRKLDVVVQELVDIATKRNIVGSMPLTVEYISDRPVPTVGDFKTKTNKKGKAVKAGESVWDVIYKICHENAFVVFVRDFRVIISDPQTLDLRNASKPKRVVFGQNLSSLTMERKLGKEKVPQVEVTGYSSKERKAISAKFPEGEADNKRTTGVGTKDEEIQKYLAHGVDDVRILKQMAEAKYNEKARSEVKISFVTKSLVGVDQVKSSTFGLVNPFPTSEDTRKEDRSLLLLRAGDPIEIGFNQFNTLDMENATYDQRYQKLREQGYGEKVAKLIAQEWNNVDVFKRPFYTKSVELTWGHKEGISVAVEAANYAVPSRNDITMKNDPQKGAKKITKSTDTSKASK